MNFADHQNEIGSSCSIYFGYCAVVHFFITHSFGHINMDWLMFAFSQQWFYMVLFHFRLTHRKKQSGWLCPLWCIIVSGLSVKKNRHVSCVHCCYCRCCNCFNNNNNEPKWKQIEKKEGETIGRDVLKSGKRINLKNNNKCYKRKNKCDRTNRKKKNRNLHKE